LVIDSPDLGRMVAQKLGSRHYDLHAPVLVERAMVRDMFLSEPMVKEFILRARMVKLAIMGIGTVQDEASSFLCAGLLNRSDLNHLRTQGAVGEIGGHFFDLQGHYETFEINQRIIGLDLNDLRQIPQSIAIARGVAKAQAILGALTGKFMRVLATDDLTARHVLEISSKEAMVQ
jgi:deoxyribonucleoside regulator